MKTVRFYPFITVIGALRKPPHKADNLETLHTALLRYFAAFHVAEPAMKNMNEP